MHKLIASLAAAAVLGAASPALASGPTDRSVTIQIAGLDLSRARDLRILDRRIAGAKEAVCGSYSQASEREEVAITACRDHVARQIDTQVASLRVKAQLALR